MAFENLATVLAALSGVAAHLAVFRKGEWDGASPSIFAFYFSATLAAVVTCYALAVPISVVAHIGCYHAAGLFGSMLLYRGFFHRLCGYPGPLLARFTTLYITAKSMKKLHLYEEVQQLHAQYGDYVRLGPRELSITDAEAVKAIYGTQSPTTKGPWYGMLEPHVSLHGSRDKRDHAQRRKAWDQGFSTRALQGYDPRITKAIRQLLKVLDSNRGRPINVSQWFAFLVFDIMEDLAFNKSSDMLGHGREAYIFKTIRANLFLVALFTRLPWMMLLLKKTPILNAEYWRFVDWIQKLIDERAQKEPELPDILSWILDAYHKGPRTERHRRSLNGDAQLIVVAGSDTTAAVLTHAFFHLAQDLVLARRLQSEFDALPSLEHDHLSTVPLLDAVLNETMRLHPAVPSGTQRVTPAEGLQIGKHHVPGDVIVQVPSHTLFRDERFFESANEFIPERWTTSPELVKDKSVFIPFNTGPYGCVGKRLAMMEMQRVVAEILWRYDVALAPGQTAEAFLDGKQDTFTVLSGPLSLVFTERAPRAW